MDIGLRLRSFAAGSAFAGPTRRPTPVAPLDSVQGKTTPGAPARNLSEKLNPPNGVIHPKEVDPAIEKPAPKVGDPNVAARAEAKMGASCVSEYSPHLLLAIRVVATIGCKNCLPPFVERLGPRAVLPNAAQGPDHIGAEAMVNSATKQISREDRMNRLFVHLNRTAGSSIWHGLAKLSAEQSVDVVDIHYHSIKNYGVPNRAADFLASVPLIDDKRERIFHHHTYCNIIPYINNPVLATVLRDPLDRFISDFFHYRKVLLSGLLSESYLDLILETLGPELVYAIGHDTSISTLLRAAKAPFFNHYYIIFFTKFFFGPTAWSPPHNLYGQKFASDDIRELAKTILQKFSVIGLNPHVPEAFSGICNEFHLDNKLYELDFQINRGAYGSVPDRVRREISQYFEDDYVLYNTILWESLAVEETPTWRARLNGLFYRKALTVPKGVIRSGLFIPSSNEGAVRDELWLNPPRAREDERRAEARTAAPGADDLALEVNEVATKTVADFERESRVP